MSKKNTAIIPDETLESYEAGAYLKGLDPILVLQDHPPLGKYMLSLSILFFDNENTIMVVILPLSLLGMFLLGKLITQNTVLSLIPVVLFSWEPLYKNLFLYTPLLEPVQLPFIVFGIYFFIRGINSQKYMYWYIVTSTMIGFVISIRFFVLGGMLALAMIGALFLLRKFKHFFAFVSTLIISVTILIVSYIKTMIDGSSLIHIFGIQKYMFIYHKSQLISPLSFWDLLLFNRWHTWWGNHAISHDPQWIILWPIATVLVGVYGLLLLLRKVTFSPRELVIFLWIFFYTALLSVGNTTTRYFLPLLPFLYIESVRLAQLVVKTYKKTRTSSLRT